MGLAINPWSLKKKELQIFLTGRCRHYHKYIEHPSCFRNEIGIDPNVGYFDLEADDLEADFGMMLSYAIKVRDKPKIYSGTISRKNILDWSFDKELVEQCMHDLMKFDVIFTYYGTRFDWRFIRTRALYWKLNFPKFGTLNHKDLYYLVRSKLKLHSNRLESACSLMGIEGKTKLKPKIWNLAKYGDEESLKYVLKHNKHDVIILERLHKRVEGYDKGIFKSI
jgi:uncharacterized protein YprB with RNaseH-like and TPR domain